MLQQAVFGASSQALWQVFAGGSSTLPAAGAAGCAAALFVARRLGRLPATLEPLSRNLLGWTATLLFMFQPLAQLVRASSKSLYNIYSGLRPRAGPFRHPAAHSCLFEVRAVVDESCGCVGDCLSGCSARRACPPHAAL